MEFCEEELTLEQKIYQMFILGYEGDKPFACSNLVNALKAGLGGVIFFTQNITDADGFKKSVQQIKDISILPPFLSIDQEGGRVERTLNLYGGSHYVSARAAAQKGEAFVKEQTEQIAKELKDFGLNMNFAPVLDVDTNPNNPIIAERSFSCDPDEVIKFGKIAAQTYLKSGIIPVSKHFPGHGDTFLDSHKDMPEVNLNLESLENIHIKPFKALLNDLPAIMAAHVHYPAFNKEKIPASISPEILNGYLRQNLGYKGLIISDDMVMGGIKKFSSYEACKRAINAGVNMFIFRNADDAVMELISSIIKAVKNKEIDIEKIDRSIEYIKSVKKCC